MFATFNSARETATIFAGAMMQLPAGRLSDRIDRRYVLAAMSGVAALAGLLIFLLHPTSPALLSPQPRRGSMSSFISWRSGIDQNCLKSGGARRNVAIAEPEDEPTVVNAEATRDLR